MSDEIDHLRQMIENQHIVEQLQYAVSNAPRDLGLLRQSVRDAIEHNAWAERLDNRIGKPVKFKEILEFIEKPPLEGLGTDLATLRRLLGEGEERVMLEEAIKRGPGGANNPHGCKGKPPDPASAEINVRSTNIDFPPAKKGGTDDVGYAVRRLSRERPDLLERVKKGELSANAAMIEAGFRKVPTILDILRRAWNKATPQDRATFLAEIQDTP